MQATKSAKPAMYMARTLDCRTSFMLFVLGTSSKMKNTIGLSRSRKARNERDRTATKHGERLYLKQHGGRYAEIRAGVYPRLFAKSAQTTDNTGDRESLFAKE